MSIVMGKPWKKRNLFSGRKFKKKSQNFKSKPGGHKSSGERSVNIIRAPTVVPDTMWVKLRYTSFVPWSQSTTASKFIISGNDIFDPDATGVGHKVLGHDQWSAFYNKYCVVSSRLDVSIVPTTGPTVVTMRPQDSTTGVTTISLEMEKPRTTYKIVSVEQGVRKIQGYQSTASQFGKSKNDIIGEQDYGSDIGGHPAVRWYWLLHGQHPDETTASTSIIYYTVTYYTQLYDRKVIAQS